MGILDVPTPDATASVKGKLKLTGDFGGTATSPKVKSRTSFTLAKSGTADYVCTDYANDSLALQAAATASAGGLLTVLAGVYTMPTAVSFPSNTVIQGVGWETHFKMDNSAHLGFMFNCNSKTGITFKDFQIDGNKTNQILPTIATLISGSQASYLTFGNIWAHDSIRQGIYLGGATNCTWINCRGTDNGAYIVSASRGEGFGFGVNYSTIVPTSNRFINCYTSGNYEGGISLYSDYHIYRPSGNIVQGCISDGDPIGLNLWYAEHTTVTGNNWRNCANYGIQLRSGRRNTITGNTIDTATNHGIYISNQAYSNDIVGNTISYCGLSGIDCESDYNTLSGNTVTSNTQHGIVVKSAIQCGVTDNICRGNGRDGINLTGAANNIVLGNRCQNNSNTDTTIGAYNGIQLQNNGGVGSTRNIVSSNWCNDNNATVLRSNLSSDAASGQAVVIIGDASIFKVGQPAQMIAGATTEFVVILSIDSNTQVTLTSNLTNSYTVAASAQLRGRTTQNRGIYETASSCDNNHITNNICLSNVTSQITTQGANTVVSHNQTV